MSTTNISATSQPIALYAAGDNDQAQAPTMDELASASSKPLMSATTMFPFALFPDTIVVDRNKVDIVHGIFFKSDHIFSILIEDIRTVGISYSLLTATITIEVRGYEKNPYPVKHLPKAKAVQVRSQILGLVTSIREKVNFDDYDDKILVKQAIEIGHTHGVN